MQWPWNICLFVVGMILFLFFFDSLQMFSPGFFCLIPEKCLKRRQVLAGIPRFQCIIVIKTVFLVDRDRGVTVENQQIIHRKSSGSPVTIW